MPNASRVQKTVSHKGAKKTNSMGQKALLTRMASRLGTHVPDVVQIKDESGEKRPVAPHRLSRFFDTIHYSYERKGPLQLRITKVRQGTAAESTL